MGKATEMKRISLRLNAKLYERVKALAKKENQSFNSYVVNLIYRELSAYEAKKETEKSIEEIDKE